MKIRSLLKLNEKGTGALYIALGVLFAVTAPMPYYFMPLVEVNAQVRLLRLTLETNNAVEELSQVIRRGVDTANFYNGDCNSARDAANNPIAFDMFPSATTFPHTLCLPAGTQLCSGSLCVEDLGNGNLIRPQNVADYHKQRFETGTSYMEATASFNPARFLNALDTFLLKDYRNRMPSSLDTDELSLMGMHNQAFASSGRRDSRSDERSNVKKNAKREEKRFRSQHRSGSDDDDEIKYAPRAEVISSDSRTRTPITNSSSQSSETVTSAPQQFSDTPDSINVRTVTSVSSTSSYQAERDTRVIAPNCTAVRAEALARVTTIRSPSSTVAAVNDAYAALEDETFNRKLCKVCIPELATNGSGLGGNCMQIRICPYGKGKCADQRTVVTQNFLFY